MLRHHFETKTPATTPIPQCWGTTSKPRHQQQIVHLNVGAPLRYQDPVNFCAGHRFETTSPARHRQQNVHLSTGPPFRTKKPSTNRTYLCWRTTSRPRERQQSVHLCAGTTSKPKLRQQIVYLTTPIPRHRQQIVHLRAGAPIRGQDTGNKSWILVLGHDFEIKTPPINRRSQCLGTTSRPRLRQQIVHLSAGAPLDQDTGNKSYILMLGHQFETKTPATCRAFQCWGTISTPRHR